MMLADCFQIEIDVAATCQSCGNDLECELDFAGTNLKVKVDPCYCVVEDN